MAPRRGLRAHDEAWPGPHDLDQPGRVRGAILRAMPRARPTTDRPLADELPGLIEEGGWSVRGLAAKAGISQPHLWRILRRVPGGNPSPAAVIKISRALGLPDDYFPEAREGLVIEAIKADPALRERVYRQLRRR